MKFGRIYSMVAEGREATHTINFPLTCRFRIVNATLPYAGESVFQIYNLAPETRRDLQKDYFQQNEYKGLIFAAGYETDLPIPVIFKGNIGLAFSYRRGPDWITEITARDGAFGQQNAIISLSVPSPYRFDEVLRKIISTMEPQNVGLGVVGNFVVPNTRGMAFSGNTWDLLTNMIMPMQAQISINKELVYILAQNEIIESRGAVQVINADNGLLESPRHLNNMLMCKMIFEPRFEMYQQVEVESVEPGNSGIFKVQQVDHVGTISGAVAEALNTEVTLFKTPESFQVAS